MINSGKGVRSMLNIFRKKDRETELNEKKEELLQEEFQQSVQQEKPAKEGFFSRLKSGLSKTRQGFINQITNLFSSYREINDELFEELEEILIQADVGVKTTMELIEGLENGYRKKTSLNRIC